jgi:hypothetical protein
MCEFNVFVIPSLLKKASSLNNIFVQRTWLHKCQCDHLVAELE